MSDKPTSFGEPALAKYLNVKARQQGVPLGGNFELTPCCNLSCKMCYVRLSKRQVDEQGGLLSAAQWKDYIKQAVDAGMLMMLLTGGEPTMRPDFAEIYEYAHESGVLVSVNTNGTLMTDEIFELFKKLPPQRINITLYGSSADTYRELCGSGEAFERVVEAIKRIKREGFSLKLNHTITGHNYADTMNVIDLAERLDTLMIHTSYVFPPARRAGESTDRLSPEEAAEMGLKASRRMMTPEEYKRFLIKSLQGDPAVSPMEECVDLTEGGAIRCRAGSSNFWLAWDGSLRPCAIIPYPTVDIKAEGGFKPAWDKLRGIVAGMHTPAKCETCAARNICHVCAAACISETGRVDGVPDYLCRRADAMINIMRRELAELSAGEDTDNEA